MRVGILTGGGDCPGLNAVIRALVLSLQPRHECVGVLRGFHGLLSRQLRPLTPVAVLDLLDEGGTLLGTHNRCDPFAWQGRDASAEVLDCLREAGIDALITIGGDGTLTLAERFSRLGVKAIGVPKTIDNDIVGNERSFGFDSAVAVVGNALASLKTTARSHGRVMLVETMGRDAGWIALEGGLAGGADAILIPERRFDLDALAAGLRERVARQGYALVCVAEGAQAVGGAQHWRHLPGGVARLGGVAGALVDELGPRLPETEVRHTLLGHLQRGGVPTTFDRVLATRFGVAAARALEEGVFGITIALQGDRCVRLPLAEVAGRSRPVPPDHELLRVTAALGLISCA